jgi:hypothetical protein
MLAFFSNEFDPFDRSIPNSLDTLTRGVISTTPRVIALGVASFCHKHGSLATMLAFFPNWLDLLDQIVSNLLDGFLLGTATATSRVAAPGVVSTTEPLNLDDNSVEAHASRRHQMRTYIQGNEYLFFTS